MSFTANNRGGRRGGDGGAGRGQRGGNSQRVLCAMCHQNHRTDEDCRPVCVRCYRRHNPNSACPQQVQQAPAPQPRPTVDLAVTQRVVGQLGDMITQLQDDMRQMQALNEQLQNTVRQQGDQINTLRRQVADLRGNTGPGLAQGPGLASAPAVAGMADAGQLVDSKPGREEEESVGGTSVPKKKPRHRAGRRKRAARDAARGEPGDIRMDVDPPATTPPRAAPATPALPQQDASLQVPPPSPSSSTQALPATLGQPRMVQLSDDGFPTIDGFVFNEQWLIRHTVPNAMVPNDEDLRGAREMARFIMLQGVDFWSQLATAARANGRDLIRQAQVLQAEEEARQQELAELPQSDDEEL